MPRLLSEYQHRYPNARIERAGGVLEVTFHRNGGPVWLTDRLHTDLQDLFYDIGQDPENRVIILTAAGGVWCDTVDPDSFIFDPTPPPVEMDRIYAEGRAIFVNLLEIRVPVIAAFPGPAPVHADIGLIADIVLASDTTWFQNQHFGNWSIPPGDGNHIIYPWLLGGNRGRHFLLTSKIWTAQEAFEWGVVAEVLPPERLMERARELAREMAQKPVLTLRYTRDVLNAELRQMFHRQLPFGLALEGFASGYGTWNGSTLHDQG
jgi:enoyl-CoA hydratase/carnithine racemase